MRRGLSIGLLFLLAGCRKHPPPPPPESEWVGYFSYGGKHPHTEARLFTGPDAQTECWAAERLQALMEPSHERGTLFVMSRPDGSLAELVSRRPASIGFCAPRLLYDAGPHPALVN